MSDQKDCYGNPFVTTNNQLPTAGGNIMVRNSDGSLSPGTWMGYAAKNS
jgi:hypothetical protein